MIDIKHILDFLNTWTREQTFLVALLTCGFSGFVFIVFTRIKSARPIYNLPRWKQRGWSQERTRRDLLDRVHSEFTVRRAQGLHEEVAAELDLKLQYSQVQPMLALANQANKPDEPLPEGTSIIDVYYSANVRKKLLILGQPGAGKTTILLELAKHLAEQAQADNLLPVPVIFECSTWTGKAPKDWLADELKRIYRLPLDNAAELLEHGEILLLLDGLDELMANRQKAFIKQLNALLETTHHFVICSRIAEYERIAEEGKLHLHNAVFIQPLQDHHIVEYLDKVNAPHVRELLTNHPKLMTLARSPLLLSMIILCHQDLPRSLPKTVFEDEYRDRILKIYINSRLTGNGSSHPPRQTRHWLSWLAIQLKGRSRTEFELEDLQPTWLETSVPFGITMVALVMVVFSICMGVMATFGSFTPMALPKEWPDTFSHRLTLELGLGLYLGSVLAQTFGVAVGLTVALAVGLAVGLAFGLAFGLALGLAFIWFVENDLNTIELVRVPHWSSLDDWMTIASTLASGLALGLALGLAVALFVGLAFGLAFGLIVGLAVGLAVALAGGLDGGLANLSIQISEKKTPNQGVRLSGLNGLIFAAFVSPILATTLHFVYNNFSWTLALGPFLIITYLAFGGIAYIQHYTLRFVLSRQGHIPFFYVRFLDQMVERKLLQRIGGSYRFLHLSLQDYCAKRGEAESGKAPPA